MSTGSPQVVVGYDRGEPSHHALQVAVDIASRLGAQLRVVHVVGLHDYPIDPEAADYEQSAQVALVQEERDARAYLADWAGEWTYEVEHGEPARVLTAIADQHDALMIVVGTHGHGMGAALQRLIGGSVSHGLVRASRRPVLVVPCPSHSQAPSSRG